MSATGERPTSGMRTTITDLPGWLSEQREAAAALASHATTQNRRRYQQGRADAFDIAYKAASRYLADRAETVDRGAE